MSLLRKLQLYGIHPKIVKWIESFLSNRKQAVVVDGHLSQRRIRARWSTFLRQDEIWQIIYHLIGKNFSSIAQKNYNSRAFLKGVMAEKPIFWPF